MSQIPFEDETLDASDGVTKLLLAAEYWKAKASALRAELGALRNQEPVAWMSSRNGFICKENKNPDYNLPLYARPIPAQSVPEGWQLVPIEPTAKMISAGNVEWEGKPTAMIWADMLAAAPKPEGK